MLSSIFLTLGVIEMYFQFFWSTLYDENYQIVAQTLVISAGALYSFILIVVYTPLLYYLGSNHSSSLHASDSENSAPGNKISRGKQIETKSILLLQFILPVVVGVTVNLIT